MKSDSTSEIAPEIAEQLDELQRASRERQAALREMAERLPAEMSRRQLVKQMAVSVRDAPDRSTVIRRTASKIGRTPVDLIRSIRNRR